MTFVYQSGSSIVIADVPARMLRVKYPTLELLRQFHRAQDAQRWAATLPGTLINLLTKHYTGITPEGRERMREAKRGDNNPNAGGLSLEHRQKISRNKQRAYRGEHNPMYNRRHTPSTRLKIGMGNMKRKHKLRWAVSPDGREHMISREIVLPPGWAWGRSRTSRRSF